MSTITVGEENSAPIDLYFEDQGGGRPVVLLAGRPFEECQQEGPGNEH